MHNKIILRMHAQQIHIKKFENTFNKEKELATVTMSLEVWDNAYIHFMT